MNGAAIPPAISSTVDLFIIGGGINGTAIARDASGRGLSVMLAEMKDLASATSSASTKLFHGGLRYLEYLEARLVREALSERETLLVAMPHISWPIRFVLPYSRDMRFISNTPVSRIMGVVMPWMKGRRPAWLIRLGLFLYDHLGGRKILPATTTLNLDTDPAGRPLRKKFRKAFEYSDCGVDDARLVVLNARDAEARGASIMTRTKVTSMKRQGGVWLIKVTGPDGAHKQFQAHAVVNAAGPWVDQIICKTAHINSTESVRLVKGSHIVTRSLYDHDKCYLFQGQDGRVIFAIPYEQDFTLIGTTDLDFKGAPGTATCSDGEKDYLCAFASQYFTQPVTRDDIVWTFSGVRPLYDDGAKSATAATRDYVLSLASGSGAPMLDVFGGKITTHRRLAEAALERIAPFFSQEKFPKIRENWTARVPMPGGDFPVDGVADLIASVRDKYPFVDQKWATRLVRAYGTEVPQVLGAGTTLAELGRAFGATLSEAEVNWLMNKEFASTADDVVWRRSKLGLRMTKEEIASLETFMTTQKGCTA